MWLCKQTLHSCKLPVLAVLLCCIIFQQSKARRRYSVRSFRTAVAALKQLDSRIGEEIITGRIISIALYTNINQETLGNLLSLPDLRTLYLVGSKPTWSPTSGEPPEQRSPSQIISLIGDSQPEASRPILASARFVSSTEHSCRCKSNWRCREDFGRAIKSICRLCFTTIRTARELFMEQPKLDKSKRNCGPVKS